MGDFSSSIQAVSLRVAKLDAAGAPLVGANNGFVTKAFTSVSFTPEYEEGEEITTKAADGSTCIYYKMPDTLKNVALELAICNPDPELYEIMNGGTLINGTTTTVNNTFKAITTNVATITTGTAHGFLAGDLVTVAGVDATFDGTYVISTVPTGTTFTYPKVNANVVSTAATGTSGKASAVGYIAPATGTDPTPNGVSVEVWSRAILAGKPAATLPYWRWVFPYVKLSATGDRVLENGAMAHTFSGDGLGNAQWSLGPANDWLYDSSTPFAYARAATAPLTTGYFSVV